MKIDNNIKKTELVEWEKLEWLQNKNLKELSVTDMEKLKVSLINNGFMMAFHIWDDGKMKYILDGHHRKTILTDLKNEGYEIPNRLPAAYVDCKNRKDAVKKVLIFSSLYAKVTSDGLYELLETEELVLDDIKLTVNLPELDMGYFEDEFYGDKKNDIGNLSERFIVPPFSVLDSRQGYWQERKQAWKKLIRDSGESRKNAVCISEAFKDEYGNLIRHNGDGVSLLDPVLAEIMNRWFGLKNCKTYDPFAGDSVFGYISDYLGNQFTGIEIRKEQVLINNKKLNSKASKYLCDDAVNILNHINENSQDLLFSCPPYFDLEIYSDLKNDASNQKTYTDFINIINQAFSNSIKCLMKNRFAVIVCGDIRDRKGFYYNFPGDIKDVFKKNNMLVYDEFVLAEMIGTASMRATQYMLNRKAVKTHQNVLVFYKGEIKEIKKIFPRLDFSEVDIGSKDLES